MCSCSHSAPSKAGKRAGERRRLPEDQALGRWGSLGVEGLREEGLGCLGGGCGMAERETDRPQRYPEIPIQPGEKKWGWGGRDGDLWEWGVQRGKMPVLCSGQGCLSQGRSPAGQARHQAGAWLQGWPWSSMSLCLIQSLLGREGTG